MRFERLEASSFDAKLVHVGAVKIGDAAGVRVLRLGGIFNQVSQFFFMPIVNIGRGALEGAIRPYRRVLLPGAVGVEIEVVAGTDRAIHVRGDDGWPMRLRRLLGRCRRGERSRCEKENNANRYE